MTKMYNINREDGFVWLAAVCNGVTYFLHRSAKIGDCFCSGQKYKDH